MPTMIYKPSADDLAPLLAEATQEGKIANAAWVDTICSALADLLRKTPATYRAFGPYWWVVKDSLSKRYPAEFGRATDAEWLDKMSYATEAYGLLAAYSYYDAAHENGLLYSNTHTVRYVDGSEREFVLADEEMEMRVNDAQIHGA